MRKKKSKVKRMYHRMAFWIGVVILGTVVGIAVQFTRAWVEPSVTAPDGNIAAPINTGAVEQTKTGTATQRADICVDPNGDGNKICLSNGGSGGSGDCICRSYANGDICYRTDINCGNGWEQASAACANSDSGGYNKITSYFFCSKSASALNPNFLYGADHTTDSCTVAGGEVLSDGTNKFCKMDPRVVTNWQGTFYRCPSGWNEYKTGGITWTETQLTSCTGQLSGTCAGTSCTTSSHAWQNKSPEKCDYYDGITIPGSCIAYDEYYGCTAFGEDTCVTDFSYYYGSQICNAKVIKIGCY